MKVIIKKDSYQNRFRYLNEKIFKIEEDLGIEYYALTAVDDDINKKLKIAFPIKATIEQRISFKCRKEYCESILENALDKVLNEN